VVVRYDDLYRFMVFPNKADSVSVIDANAVLLGSVAQKLLESVAARRPKIARCARSLQAVEQSSRFLMKLGRKRSPGLGARSSKENIERAPVADLRALGLSMRLLLHVARQTSSSPGDGFR